MSEDDEVENQIANHHKLDYDLINGGIYLYTAKGDKYYLCTEMEIDYSETDLMTGEVTLEISYLRKGKVKNLKLPRKELTKAGLLRMFPAKGIDITDKNAEDVLKYLLYKEERASELNSHNVIGWHTIDDQRVFLHNEAIGLDEESEYRGIHNIEPKGSLEEYMEFVNQEVIGNPNLELMLILGLAAPIASRLRKLVGLEVLFIHTYGFSTSGKSTALMLALSTFGYPGKNNHGLQKSWVATYNALIGFLAGVHGIPIGLDEASVRAGKDYSNIIYTIAEGKDKARQNQDGINREAAEWSGIVLSTGENSLLSGSNANQGIRVRNTELADIVYTNSAEHAEKIKSTVQRQYGYIGIEFVNHIIKICDEEMINAFEEAKTYVLGMMPNRDQFTDRVANKFAVIALTATLVKHYLDLNVDRRALLQILVNADSAQHEDRNLPLKAYEYLKEEINRNLNKFIYKPDFKGFTTAKSGEDQKMLPNNEIIGRILSRSSVDRRDKIKRYEDDVIKDDELVEVAIINDVCRRLLRDGGFTNPEIIFARWRELGIISCDKGKMTKKRVVIPKTKEVRCVVLNMDNEYEKNHSVRKKHMSKEARVKARHRDKTSVEITRQNDVSKLFDENEED